MTGGVACWRLDKPLAAFPMPKTEDALVALLKGLIEPGKSIAFVEKVSGFLGKPLPGSKMFVFGQNFGFLRGALRVLGVEVELVLPQKWQKPLGLGKSVNCVSRTEWKNKLKGCARRLFPALKPTLLTADAILIMDFGLNP